jgi:cation transport ATPase
VEALKKKLKRRQSAKKQLKMQPNVLGVLMTLLIVILGAIMGGQLMLQGVIPESKVAWVAAVVMFVATCVGALPAIAGTSKGKLTASYLNAVIAMAVAIVVKLIAFPGSAFENWFVPLAAVMGATCAGLLAAKKKKTRRY